MMMTHKKTELVAIVVMACLTVAAYFVGLRSYTPFGIGLLSAFLLAYWGKWYVLQRLLPGVGFVAYMVLSRASLVGYVLSAALCLALVIDVLLHYRKNRVKPTTKQS